MYHYGFGVKEERAKAHALYRQSAALGNLKAREALVTFDRFSWSDQRSQDIYTGRVASYMSAINGCQLRANAGFFVLKIDVRVAPAFFLFANEIAPPFDVDLGVIFAAQPHIAPIAGRNFRRR